MGLYTIRKALMDVYGSYGFRVLFRDPRKPCGLPHRKGLGLWAEDKDLGLRVYASGSGFRGCLRIKRRMLAGERGFGRRKCWAWNGP